MRTFFLCGGQALLDVFIETAFVFRGVRRAAHYVQFIAKLFGIGAAFCIYRECRKFKIIKFKRYFGNVIINFVSAPLLEIISSDFRSTK